MGDRKQSQADSKEVEEVLNKQAVDGISTLLPALKRPWGWAPGFLANSPIRQNKCTVRSSLLESIIPFSRVIGTRRKHGEFLVHIAFHERQQRHDRQDQVRHERGHDFREGIRDSVVLS